jgi:nucleotide-binding universal stress UspA family protein
MSALELAFQTLPHDGGRMRLIHVVDLVTPTIPRLAWEVAGGDYTEQLTQRAWQELRTMVPLSNDFCGRVQIQVSAGLVVEEIVRSATEMKTDLVVMGVTARGRLGRLLGSTTGRLLRRVECPVLAVPHRKGDTRADEESDVPQRAAA